MTKPIIDSAGFPKDGKRPTGIRRGGAVFVLAVLLTILGCSAKGRQPAGARQGLANPVSVAKVTLKDVPLQIGAIGNAEAVSTVQVKAQVGGPIVGVYFKEGQDVNKGDLLFKIDPRPFEIALKQAESNLAKDRALLKNADDELSRYAGLAEKDYVTKERFDQLRVNSDVLRASVSADEAAVDNMRLQLEYCSISSPIAGRTGGLQIYEGNLVKASDSSAMVVIYQTSPIYVSFAVPEQNLPLIKRYMAQGKLKTEVTAEDQPNPIPGVLTFVDNGIDTTTGTILLKATFPNQDKALWPGQFLHVVLWLTIDKDVFVVPSPAVQAGQNGQFVMVVRNDLTVESRPVEVDRIYGQDSVIRTGVKPGETVVTDGLLRLVPGARVEIKKVP